MSVFVVTVLMVEFALLYPVPSWSSSKLLAAVASPDTCTRFTPICAVAVLTATPLICIICWQEAGSE